MGVTNRPFLALIAMLPLKDKLRCYSVVEVMSLKHARNLKRA